MPKCVTTGFSAIGRARWVRVRVQDLDSAFPVWLQDGIHHTRSMYIPARPPQKRKDLFVSVSMRIQGVYDDDYLPEPLKSHREHEEPCSLRAPRHVRRVHFLTVAINVLN